MHTNVALEIERYNLRRLGSAGYYVGLHIRFTSPMIVLADYPRAWTEHYTEQAYALRDPIVAWGYSATGSTRWSEIDIPDPFNILGQAAEHGLRFGVSVSLGELKSRTIGSVARDDRQYNDAEIKEITTLIHKLHAKTQPPESLTDAQVEALGLIAGGMRHAEAAEKLGISGSALKARLTAARSKLLARNTAEAIQRAKDYRIL